MLAVGGNVKVLIAEDDPASLLLLKVQLRRFGHDVTAVPDGRRAWAAYEAERYSLVISDCMMPEMDGFELCRRVRALKGSTYTYVILLTSDEGADKYDQGIAAGADDFLVKPLDAGQIQARLKLTEKILRLEQEVTVLRARLRKSEEG